MTQLKWELMDWGAWRVRGVGGLIEVDPRGSQWRWRVYQSSGYGLCDTLAEAQAAALADAMALHERTIANFAALLAEVTP